MIPAKAYAAMNAETPLVPYQFNRRDLRPDDVQVEILYCGVCHSDLQQVRNEWGGSIYPMVPGHEIVGKVVAVGSAVTGGMKETQEMLDYCAEKNIVADVELIRMNEVNDAYTRMLKGDVKYRFVIDVKTL